MNPVVARNLKISRYDSGSRDSITSVASSVDSRRKKSRIYLPSFSRLRQVAFAKNANEPISKQPQSPSTSPNENNKPTTSSVYLKFKKAQKILYLAMEEPTSSLFARIIFVLIIIGILFSTVNTIIETTRSSDSPSEIGYIETGISICFIIEFFLRMVSSTAFGEPLYKFFLSGLNIIDVVALLPFFLDFAIQDTSSGSLRAIRIIRLVRIFRIFKISRYITGTITFIDGIRRSLSSLGFLVFLIVFLDATLATVLYYVEQGSTFDPDSVRSEITSLTEAMWVTMVTLSSVGYGDVYPRTILGKVFACLFAVVGMLMFAIPVAVLGNNFQDAYTRKLEKDKIEAYKEEKFKNNTQNLTEAQKEMYFMSERISSIDQTNEKIMELLQHSKTLYGTVARNVRHLYRSIYDEEDQLQKRESMVREESKSPVHNLQNKMDSRIQLMEKLMKAKRKIKITNLFRGMRDPSKRTEFSLHDSSMHCEQGDFNNGEMTPQRDRRRALTLFPIKMREDLNTSTYIPTELHPERSQIPVSNYKNYMRMYDSYASMSPRISSIKRGRRAESLQVSRKSEYHHIKSSTLENENEIIRFYNENFGVLSKEMLQELLNSDLDISPSEEEEPQSGIVREMNNFIDKEESVSPRILLMKSPRKGSDKTWSSSLKTESIIVENKHRANMKKTSIFNPKQIMARKPSRDNSRMWEEADSIISELEKKGRLGNLRKPRSVSSSFSRNLQSLSRFSKPMSYNDSQILRMKVASTTDRTSRKLIGDEWVPSTIAEDEKEGYQQKTIRRSTDNRVSTKHAGETTPQQTKKQMFFKTILKHKVTNPQSVAPD